MSEEDHGPQTQAEREAAQLLELLLPIHDQARRSARRLCHSWADGDDLFHEAVLRARQKLGGLREPGRFRSWFYAVLLSVHRDRGRRAFWRRFLQLSEAPPPAPAPPGEEERARADRIGRALALLPAVQREAVVLFEVDGFTIEEIASMQGASVTAVKSRLARGRDRLRRHYGDLGRSEEAPSRQEQRAWTSAERAAPGPRR